jgi:hypothetical protein
MIDNYSSIQYDTFEVIEENLYGNWYNKFQMYDKFRDGENLYFDLDIIIYNRLPNLFRKKFTLLDDKWWREPAHTPLNSSIVSWTGDVSYIWDKFWPYAEVYMKKYNKGSDEWYYKEMEYEMYIPVCPKFNMEFSDPTFGVCTLGQMHHIMEEGWTGWWSKYLLKSSS